MRTGRIAVLVCWQMIAALCGFAETAPDSGYMAVTGPCHLTFPADHGPHPAYRTEWWYYTGNVADEANRRFGFQLTFFRSRLQSPGHRHTWPEPSSAWRTDQLYLAHAAVSDLESGRHLQADQMARPVLSMAGAYSTDNTVSIRLLTWQTKIAAKKHQLKADADDFSIALDLEPIKPPVLHGDSGYSRKGQSAERASCYYSFTRLQTTGVLTVDGRRHTVQGSAWMDHEFSTAPLQPDIVGWDWFSLQLNDNTEAMVYLLRHKDGRLNPASSGTFIFSSGAVRHLARDNLRITPLSWWTSPRSGGRYPTKWRMIIAAMDLNLTITANLADQEMNTADSTGVIYWEGSVQADGRRGQAPIKGVGYVEMTGYARPFDAPM